MTIDSSRCANDRLERNPFEARNVRPLVMSTEVQRRQAHRLHRRIPSGDRLFNACCPLHPIILVSMAVSTRYSPRFIGTGHGTTWDHSANRRVSLFENERPPSGADGAALRSKSTHGVKGMAISVSMARAAGETEPRLLSGGHTSRARELHFDAPPQPRRRQVARRRSRRKRGAFRPSVGFAARSCKARYKQIQDVTPADCVAIVEGIKKSPGTRGSAKGAEQLEACSVTP